MKALERYISRVPDWLIIIRRHKEIHGQFPNLIRPKTFNEKIVHRMLFDRRPLLTQLADKAAVRSYVEDRLGPQILPKLYHSTSRPETIPFAALPERFVVKPTHGSGWVHIVTDKYGLDRAALVRTCNTWLNESFYEKTREWVYKNIEPRIIVEEFVDDGSGAAPSDYKLFVFGGVVEMIQVDVGRFTDHRRRLYSRGWKKLDIRFLYNDIGVDVPAPVHLAEMIAAAETLARDLDFIRADFYDTPSKMYFGELTTMPEAGVGVFTPTEYDRYLGGLWKLPK